MNQLPNEILQVIFQHIDGNEQCLLACTLVNRCFYTLTIPILWRYYSDIGYLEDNDWLSTIPYGHLRLAMQSPSPSPPNHPILTCLRKLELFAPWTDTELIRLMSLASPYLRELYILNGPDLTDRSLQLLPQHWCHLTTIQLSNVSVTRTTTNAIAQNCHKLEHFTLNQCTSITPDMFRPFCQRDSTTGQFPTRLAQLFLLDDEKVESVWNHETIMDWARLPLTEFGFQGNYVSSDAIDAVLVSLSLTSPDDWRYWYRLKRLDLEFLVDLVHDSQLIAIFKLRPMLTHVSIGHSKMTDATLEAMAMYLPLLLVVNVHGSPNITAQGVMHLVRHCLYLTFVTIVGCDIASTAFPDNTITDQDAIEQGAVNWLRLNAINAIRHGNDNDDIDYDFDTDDDEDQVWLRIWERSFINLRHYGSDIV